MTEWLEEAIKEQYKKRNAHTDPLKCKTVVEMSNEALEDLEASNFHSSKFPLN